MVLPFTWYGKFYIKNFIKNNLLMLAKSIFFKAFAYLRQLFLVSSKDDHHSRILKKICWNYTLQNSMTHLLQNGKLLYDQIFVEKRPVNKAPG